MEKSREKYKKYVSLVLILLSCILLAYHAEFLSHTNIILQQNEFSCPSYMLVGVNGNQYIINDSTRQILVLDSNGNYLFQIDGGTTKEKGFNFANNIAVDEVGNIYVTDVSFNGNYDRDQKIKLLKYNPDGSFHSILYQQEYTEEEQLTIHSAFMCVSYHNQRFYYAQREKDSIAEYSIAVDGSEQVPILERRITYTDAQLLVAAIAIIPEKNILYFANKKGDIFRAGEEISLIYNGGNYHEEYAFYDVPNDLALSADGATLYFTDIGLRRVCKLDLVTGEQSVIYESLEGSLDERAIFYRLSIAGEGKIAFCDSDGNEIYIYDEEGAAYYEGATFTYSSSVLARYIALVFLGICVLIYILLKVKSVCSNIMAGSNAERFKTNILVLVAMATVFISTAAYVVTSLTNRYTENVLQSLYSMTRLTAEMVDGDLLEKLESPDDYLNEDYMAIREQIQDAFAKSYTYEFKSESDNTLYCVLYRMQNNVVYYTMHLSDDSGVVYPDTLTFEDSDYKYIEDTGKTIIFSEISTGEGEWMYASAPIYNSAGEMIAVCEVGKNRTSYNQANQSMLIEVTITVGSLAIVVFLMMSEIIALISVIEEKRKKQTHTNGNVVEYVRTFSFILFMADNFTCVLIPLMSEALYNPSMPIAQGVAMALPLGAQSLASAVTGFAAAGVLEKLGNRKSFIGGILFHIAGLILCGLSTNLYMFTLAMLIVGTGMGINAVCLNTYVVNRDDEDEIISGFGMITTGTFAGTNCGIVIGSLLTENYGYSLVFFLSAATSVLLLLFVLAVYKKEQRAGQDTEVEIRKISMPQFLENRFVWGYLIFAMLPYFVFASFVYYFMPLFAAQKGISESNIGVITLVYGMATAYLTSLTSDKITKRVGMKISIVIASVITIVATAVFIVSPSVPTILFVVMVMGIADSFGYSALSSYYSTLDAVRQYGVDNALGISGIVEGIASTIAPFIFAAALLAGVQFGMLLIAIGFCICVVMFLFTSMKGGKKII